MSTYTSIATVAAPSDDPERGHRIRIRIAWTFALVLIAAILAYGFDYYRLSPIDRPFSAKHLQLRPSGAIGVKLGMLGFSMFAFLFLYPLRKKIAALGRIGKTRHWLDFHIVLGVTAPLVIAFHASFKFRGIAGMAFWIMLAVAISGIVGRYIYAQIPRSLSSTELSLAELASMERELTEQLASQHLVSARELAPLFHLPNPERVQQESMLLVFLEMLALDVARPFKIARLRLAHSRGTDILVALCGLRSTGNKELEAVIKAARRKSSLSKRALFLTRTQQVFNLWHVVHRPFSYSFAVLALLHVGVALLLGFL